MEFYKLNMTQASPLLSLSGELRNVIYRHALISDTILHFGPDVAEQTQLLRVCRQIRNEAESIFWSENEFYTRLIDERLPLTEEPTYAPPCTNRERLKLVRKLYIKLEFDEELRRNAQTLANNSQPQTLYEVWGKHSTAWIRSYISCGLPRSALAIMPMATPDAAAAPREKVLAAMKANFNKKMEEFLGLPVKGEWEQIMKMMPPHLQLATVELDVSSA